MEHCNISDSKVKSKNPKEPKVYSISSLGSPKDLFFIPVPGDGSCFFHSIISGLFLEYAHYSDVDKRKYIMNVRKTLSVFLPSVYSKLSRGMLLELSNEIPEYRLDSLTKLLQSSSSVGVEFIELISLYYNCDIYILYKNSLTPYIIGDEEYLHRNRQSIVILYKSHHYELLCCKRNDTIITLFDPSDSIICWINDMIKFKVTKI